MKKLKKLPQFKSEKEERDFWLTHDSTEYIDWSKAKRVNLADLGISTTELLTSETIEINLPNNLVEKVRARAKRLKITPHSLITQLISQGIDGFHSSKHHQ